MNNKTRNQLIGFVTLILLILLILPYIINDKPRKTKPTIPPQPLISVDISNTDNTDVGDINANVGVNDDTTNEPMIVNDDVNDKATSHDTINTENKPSTTANPHHEPNKVTDNNNTKRTTANEQTTKGYTIQLVALRNRQKIEQLVALLRLNNYDAYTVPQLTSEIPQDGLIVLFVGHYSTKKQAESMMADLENLTTLKNFIVITTLL